MGGAPSPPLRLPKYQSGADDEPVDHGGRRQPARRQPRVERLAAEDGAREAGAPLERVTRRVHHQRVRRAAAPLQRARRERLEALEPLSTEELRARWHDADAIGRGDIGSVLPPRL